MTDGPKIALISDGEGQPQTIGIELRPSGSSASRLKAHFTVSTKAGLSARGIGIVEGTTALNIPEDAPDEVPICPEFRIELN